MKLSIVVPPMLNTSAFASNLAFACAGKMQPLLTFSEVQITILFFIHKAFSGLSSIAC
jgi:hypothetical protein